MKILAIDDEYRLLQGLVSTIRQVLPDAEVISYSEVVRANAEIDPKEIELYYKVSCYEGDRLLWYRRGGEEGLEFCAKLENGTEIFFARLQGFPAQDCLLRRKPP